MPDPRTLVVTISQSGETADTLAALKHARSMGMEQTLTICNMATSAMVRECKLAYITDWRSWPTGVAVEGSLPAAHANSDQDR